MFANIMQPNINGVNISGSLDINLPQKVQNIQPGQDSFSVDSFIAIITAILSSLNNAAMMNGENGLFSNKNDFVGFSDTMSTIDNNSADGLSVITQQMTMQLIIPNSYVPVANNLSSVNGEVIDDATLNLNIVFKPETGLQQIKNDMTINLNKNSTENFPTQIRKMVDTISDHDFKKFSDAEGKIFGAEHKALSTETQESGVKLSYSTIDTPFDTKSAMQNTDMQIKTTVQRVSSVKNQTLDIEHMTSGAENKLSHDTGRVTHDTIASISQIHVVSSTEKDLVVTVKEPIHVNRLYELGEVMEKTIRSGDKHLIIKIEPPDLGSIQIKLKMDNGMLRADFKVDSVAVKDLFSMAIPQIKTSLENAGIRVSDFFVDVKDDYYSDNRGQHDNVNQQNKQNKKQDNFFDYFA